MRENDEFTGGAPVRGDPTRLVALADGAFAIIMTLMVLELRVPRLEEGHSLAEALWEESPAFAVFLMSFLLTGVYWISHRDCFNLVLRTNAALMWLNIAFLLVASLIPFAASTLGTYPLDPTALVVYGVLLAGLAGVRLTLYRYVTGRPELLWEPVAPERRRAVTAVLASALAVYPVAIAFAALAPPVVLAVYAVTPLGFVLAVTRAHGKPAAVTA